LPRLAFAVLALGVFIYTYMTRSIVFNEMLALLGKGQFSAALSKTGILGGTVLVILGVTLLCGRLSCSLLCPLGTLQELFWRAGLFLRRRGPRGKAASRPVRRGYNSPPRVRYVVPLLAGVGAAFAFFPFMMAADPLSTFGRGIGAFRAFLVSGNAGIFTAVIALPPAIILVIAFFRGRAFCDWCPVGLTLGLLSSAAPFGMKLSSRCISCGRCEQECPSGCIDSREKRLDNGRCVLCFSCTAVCPSGGAVYGFRYSVQGKPAPANRAASFHTAGRGMSQRAVSRRIFLKGLGKVSFFCGAAYLLGPSIRLFVRGGKNAGSAAGALQILPPGAKSRRHYDARCIGCQACVASCPVGVITVRNPSPQPVLDYTRSGCQYNCVECGKVCPTGAIRRLSVEEKRQTRVAVSNLEFGRCVVNIKRESCGACAEVCPTGAITMTAYAESGVARLTRPVLDVQYCIGCGACYAACPAEPRALSITAVEEQTLTLGVRPADESGDELRIPEFEDFPF
jgi:ferredoxin